MILELGQNFKAGGELFPGGGGGGWGEDGGRPFGKEPKPNPEGKAQRAQGVGGSGRWFLQQRCQAVVRRNYSLLRPLWVFGGVFGILWLWLLLLWWLLLFKGKHTRSPNQPFTHPEQS